MGYRSDHLYIIESDRDSGIWVEICERGKVGTLELPAEEWRQVVNDWSAHYSSLEDEGMATEGGAWGIGSYVAFVIIAACLVVFLAAVATNGFR
jgi:hypothetical protein